MRPGWGFNLLGEIVTSTHILQAMHSLYCRLKYRKLQKSQEMPARFMVGHFISHCKYVFLYICPTEKQHHSIGFSPCRDSYSSLELQNTQAIYCCIPHYYRFSFAN